MGKGGAVIEGLKAARFDLVAFTDSDESVSPQEFQKIVSAIDSCDAAIGSRALKESIIPKKQPFIRHFQGRMFRILVNFLFGLNIKDSQCGAKVFKKNAIKKTLPMIKLKGWAFDVNILWELKKNNFSIKEVPIIWIDDKNTKLKTGDVFKMLKELLSLRFG